MSWRWVLGLHLKQDLMDKQTLVLELNWTIHLKTVEGEWLIFPPFLNDEELIKNRYIKKAKAALEVHASLCNMIQCKSIFFLIATVCRQMQAFNKVHQLWQFRQIQIPIPIFYIFIEKVFFIPWDKKRHIYKKRLICLKGLHTNLEQLFYRQTHS